MSKQNDCISNGNAEKISVNHNKEYKIFDGAFVDVYATFQFVEKNEVESVSVRIDAKEKHKHSIKKVYYCANCDQFEVTLKEGEDFNNPFEYKPNPGKFIIKEPGTKVVRIIYWEDEDYKPKECYLKSQFNPAVKRGRIMID